MLKELFDVKMKYLSAEDNTYEKVDLRNEYFKLLNEMREKFGEDIDMFDDLINIAHYFNKTYEQTLNAYIVLGGTLED